MVIASLYSLSCFAHITVTYLSLNIVMHLHCGKSYTYPKISILGYVCVGNQYDNGTVRPVPGYLMDVFPCHVACIKKYTNSSYDQHSVINYEHMQNYLL